MSFANLEDVKRVGQELILFVIGRVLEHRREELKVLERDVTKLEAIQAPFHRMSYDDAVVRLKGKGSEIEWGSDLGNTDETLITDDRIEPITAAGADPYLRMLDHFHGVVRGETAPRRSCADSIALLSVLERLREAAAPTLASF
jgi:predicted dehydrogenase